MTISQKIQRIFLCLIMIQVASFMTFAQFQETNLSPLPGTKAWNVPADPAKEMVEGIHKHLDYMLENSFQTRDRAWVKSVSSPEEKRARFLRLTKTIGAVEPPAAHAELQRLGTLSSEQTSHSGSVALSSKVRVDRVRWPVFEDTWMEGLMVEPIDSSVEIKFSGIVMGDADEAPEILAGLESFDHPRCGLAARLAEAGGRILIPTLLNRDDKFSGDSKVRFTNLSHREWIWRMGWETGRTPVGYEVDAVVHGLHLLDSLQNQKLVKDQPRKPLVVVGHGEGGLIALITSAVDSRVKAAWVSGYFQKRDQTGWLEPIDRTVWRQALEFQDAELAAMAATKSGDGILVIDRTDGPVVSGPKPPKNGRDDASDGSLRPATTQEIDSELQRARKIAGEQSGRIIDVADQKAAVVQMEQKLGVKIPLSYERLKINGGLPDSDKRMKTMVMAWADHTQKLLKTSELRRFEHWKSADPLKPLDWTKKTEPLRNEFWEDQIGKLPEATEPLQAESKLVYDQLNFRGYAVKIPLYKEVYAYGVLLLPKDLKKGEKRPVVVCQHGLEGRPGDVVDPAKKSVYHAYGAELADRGYIVFAPQNPYIGHERFRTIQRKAWPLGQSLFSVIFRQHERIIEWLETQDYVDPSRIAFYGLSYGGKSAMRIPAALPKYCLSICSADFNEWVVKCTNTDRQYSYMFTVEYDMYEWDLASRFNYAEMAGLIAPRPFLIERGHFDGVGPDDWIGYEFGKVKRTYDLLGVGDKTDIAYFNRGHEIDGVATFAFLAKHLDWPRGAKPLVIKK
jgi:dienelactone hydrolase